MTTWQVALRRRRAWRWPCLRRRREERGPCRRVNLVGNPGARLCAIRRRATGTYHWQLSAPGPDGGRSAGASRHCMSAALLEWVGTHSELLEANEADRLQGLAGFVPGAAPVVAASEAMDHSDLFRVPPCAPDGCSMATGPTPPPPSLAGEVTVESAIPSLLKCPLCTGCRQFATQRTLARHLASRHVGCLLGDRGAASLRGMHRGVCGACGGLRAYSSRMCHFCATIAPPRPAQPTDRIRDPVGCARRAPAPASQGERTIAPLPEDWEPRVRALPAHTLPHVPACVRLHVCAAMAQSLEAMLADDADRFMELGRSKLLLSVPPKGFHLRAELEKRCQMWRDGEWDALLARAESQAAQRQQESRQPRNIGSRARQLAREGAYRKAVTALTGSTAELTSVDQRRWAGQLLPPSRLPPDQACAGTAPAAPLSGAAGVDIGDGSSAASHASASLWGQALQGVRFAALSAPGPSGMRPEHLREALLAGRRSSVNRLLKAIAEVGARGRSGALPLSARWLVDSQVVFLRKPRTQTPRPIRVGEVWRRVVAKQLISCQRDALQRLFLQHRQAGVAMPGGAEALIHLRRCLEQSAELSEEAVVVLD